jgi:hypothetical protein
MEPREPEWLTWAEVGERLNVSPHAARAKATRMGWRRQLGNDGKTRVLVALEPRAPDQPPMSPRSPPARKSVDPALMHAVEAHNATLKADVERLEAQLTYEKARTTATEVQLAEANARADKAIAALGALADQIAALAEARKPWWRRLVG